LHAIQAIKMREHVFGHLFEQVDATLVRTDTLPYVKVGDE
jgi:hypothetical protein